MPTVVLPEELFDRVATDDTPKLAIALSVRTVVVVPSVPIEPTVDVVLFVSLSTVVTLALDMSRISLRTPKILLSFGFTLTEMALPSYAVIDVLKIVTRPDS